MKKIKIIAPILGATAALTPAIVLASCGASTIKCTDIAGTGTTWISSATSPFSVTKDKAVTFNLVNSKGKTGTCVCGVSSLSASTVYMKAKSVKVNGTEAKTTDLLQDFHSLLLMQWLLKTWLLKLFSVKVQHNVQLHLALAYKLKNKLIRKGQLVLLLFYFL